MTPSGDHLRRVLRDPHVRKHGRGRILDAIATCSIVARADGHAVSDPWASRSGSESYQFRVDGRSYFLRRRAGSGAPRENGVIYLLDAERLGRPVAEFRRRKDVEEWFDSL
jgi:hypothetical protein